VTLPTKINTSCGPKELLTINEEGVLGARKSADLSAIAAEHPGFASEIVSSNTSLK
jgi:hypothetical protein